MNHDKAEGKFIDMLSVEDNPADVNWFGIVKLSPR